MQITYLSCHLVFAAFPLERLLLPGPLLSLSLQAGLCVHESKCVYIVHECIELPGINQYREAFPTFVCASKLEFAGPKLTLTLMNTCKSQSGFRERTGILWGGKCPNGR